jgi:hypothetical protein
MLSLKDLCCIKIVLATKTFDKLENLLLPPAIKNHLIDNAASYFDKYIGRTKDCNLAIVFSHLNIDSRNPYYRHKWSHIGIKILRSINNFNIHEYVNYGYYKQNGKKYCDLCIHTNNISNWSYTIKKYCKFKISKIQKTTAFCSNCYDRALFSIM